MDGGSTTNNEIAPVRSEAEELAGMVWAFVNAAGGLVEGLDAEVSSLLCRFALLRCHFPTSSFLSEIDRTMISLSICLPIY